MTIYSILVIVQVFIALALIGLILVQHGKGADAGAAFGSGASGTVFGAQGSANFLTHVTAALAVVFFALSLTLAYLVGGNTAPSGNSVTEQLEQKLQQPVPDIPNQGGALPQAPASGGAEDGQPTGAAASGQAGSNQDLNQNQGVTAEIPE